MSISTVSSNQHEILHNILKLYTAPQTLYFDADVTYSKGGFYTDSPPFIVPQPKRKYDLEPKVEGVIKADCRDLPLESASLRSIVFDPPFLHAPGADSVMGERFGGFRNQHELRAMYFASLVEFYRVLITNGILVFKCQDIIESGKQVLNHCHVWSLAHGLGFVDLDLFILLKTSTMTGHNWDFQQHAHRGHSYFMIFKKGPRR